MATHVNGYAKGMNLDISENKVDNQHYYIAENMRQITKTGLTGHTMHNIDGFLLGVNLPSGYAIHGMVNIRDYIIVFGIATNKVTGDATDRIIVFTQNYDGSLDLYSPYVYQGDLGFVLDNPVQTIVGRYESSSIIKIYWIAEGIGIKFCNVLDPNLLSYTSTRLDIIPAMYPGSIAFTSLGSGQLPVGMVQYHYQLFNMNGAQTGYISSSTLIPLTTSVYTGTTLGFVGANEGIVSGKSVNLTFTGIDVTFDMIRILRTTYTSALTMPSVDVIAELATTSTLNFTDYGVQLLDSMTIDSFNILNYSFIPTDLETKNNILFASNIKENTWDIDYDARAYRFCNDGTGYVRATIWSNNITSGNYINVTLSTIATVPTTHDCINIYNDVSQDSYVRSLPAFKFKYKANGTTLGGQGPNISFIFTSSSFNVRIDSSITTNSTVSLNSYANPSNVVSLVGYQRDEIYPFAIELINTQGKWSTAKWICDIRMPNYDEDGFPMYTQVGSLLDAKPLFVVFTVTNLPTDCVGYRILRCERKDDDRTIIAQGIGSPVTADAVHLPTLFIPTIKQINSGTYSYVGQSGTFTKTLQKDLLEFISPDINFKNGIVYQGGDYLQYIGNLSETTTYIRADSTKAFTAANIQTGYYYGTNNTQEEQIFKYYNFSPTTSWITPFTIIDSKFVNTPINRESNQNSVLVGTYNYFNAAMAANFVQGKHGSTQIINTASNINLSSITTDTATYGSKVPVFLYRRPIIGYGGNTYNARSTRVYIPCGDITLKATTTTTINKGDTYICNFEYIRLMTLGLDTENVAGYPVNESILQDINFPVETSINLDYTTNLNYSNFINNSSAFLMQESVGIYTKNSHTFTQNFNLYNYNGVYSRANNTTGHYPLPLNVVINPTFDHRIQASNRKFDNETVDSWTIWAPLGFKDVDGLYGPISAMVNYIQDLVYFQESAIGVLAVEERIMLPSNGTQSLTLGTGGIMSRYDYFTTTAGCVDYGSIEIGNYGLIFYDHGTNSFFSMDKGSGTMNISKISGIQSWLNNIFPADSNTSVITGYAPRYNEILISVITDNVIQYNTICYNELSKTFVSFYTITPSMYLGTTNFLYSVSNSIPNKLWQHDAYNKGSFYGTVYPARLSLIINPDEDIIDRYDIIHWLSQHGGGIEDLGRFTLDTSKFYEDLTPATFTYLTAQNSYQTTGKITLIPGTNLIRRFRTWRFNQLRDSTSRARLVDSYLLVTFEYDNSSNKPLIMYDVTTEYASSVPH